MAKALESSSCRGSSSPSHSVRNNSSSRQRIAALVATMKRRHAISKRGRQRKSVTLGATTQYCGPSGTTPAKPAMISVGPFSLAAKQKNKRAREDVSWSAGAARGVETAGPALKPFLNNHFPKLLKQGRPQVDDEGYVAPGEGERQSEYGRWWKSLRHRLGSSAQVQQAALPHERGDERRNGGGIRTLTTAIFYQGLREYGPAALQQ